MAPSYLDLDADGPDAALVVVAHPDDIDFGVAGTAARLVQAGARVTYCLVTSGDAGAPEELARHEVAAIREGEQRAAAAAVGVTDVRFLGLPDGRLVADMSLRSEITRVIRDVRPGVVITQNPQRNWDRIYASHPDHLAVGEATIAAVYPDARNPHAHPELLAEGFQPHVVSEVWVSSLEPQDVFIDITEVMEHKIAALGSHTSQLAHGRFDIEELLRNWAADTTARLGLPDGRLTEAFRRIHTE